MSQPQKPRPLTHERFKRIVRRALFEKPKQGVVPDDYEPTQEELDEGFCMKSDPLSEQQKAKHGYDKPE